MPKLKFTPPNLQKPGTIAAILKTCYVDLVASDPGLWGDEEAGWERFDKDVYENSDGIVGSTFLSWLDNDLIGFASYDPRQWPALGVIGHNAVLPEFQDNGFGKSQILEILRRFHEKGFKRAKVSTLDIPFFIPAQKMYLGCGFHLKRWIPWERCQKFRLIEYEMDLR
jgi:GNAT superfamily N-acetyltransferase